MYEMYNSELLMVGNSIGDCIIIHEIFIFAWFVENAHLVSVFLPVSPNKTTTFH